jgi:predicted Zn-dependent peptidase
VANVPTDHIIARTQKLFDRPRQELLSAADRRPCAAQGPKQVVEKAGKGQSYLYLGAILNEVAPADRAALDIMNAILSSRVAFELREKKGLAYALGTSLGLHDGWGWLVATIGTRPQNLEAARNGILEQIEAMRTAAPDAKEVEKNINAYVGRMLMRRLSRINAAYYYGLYEFEGLGYDYYERSLAEWRKVTKEDVERVANKYLPRDQFVTVIVE